MIDIGTVIKNRYEIIARLGKGGMSTVFLARDRSLGSYWAIKQVEKNKNIDIEAFIKEVELLSSLNHVQIPRIVDRIDFEDNYCVCMDFIDGISLGKKVSVEGPQKEKNVVEWAIKLCDVLEYLHTVRGNPIVYSDMKPGNVMLTNSGNIMLVDFGIARECSPNNMPSVKVGTKGYAAPEQYKGQALNERTDIYSLGVTLFNLVTGMEPNDPPNAVVPIRNIDSSLSEGLEYIINKCTELNPDMRYKSCKELRHDLVNIDKLNMSYRKKVGKKLLIFMSLFLLFVISSSITLVGHLNMEKQIQSDYDNSFIKGVEYEKADQKDMAIDSYKEAIEYKPEEVDTYIRLFNIMLSKDGEDTKEITKNAIDVLKKYVDNRYSPIYHNTKILQMIAKKSLDVNETIYAEYAAEYYSIIKESSEYKNGKVDKNEIDSLSIIASSLSTDISNIDFDELGSELESLGKNTEESNNIDDNQRLNTYYVIMTIYSSYANKLDDSYENIISYGEKSKEILDDTLRQEEITFTDTIPLYRLVASSLYSRGISDNNVESKRSKLEEAIKWFDYLELFDDNMPESLEIKKGGAYKAIVDTYTSLEQKGNVNNNVFEYANKSAQIFKKVLNKNNNSFVAQVNLVQIYIDMQKIGGGTSDNLQNIIIEYQKLTELKEKSSNLSKTELLQFNAVKENIEMLNLKDSGLS